ncbi:MAG: GTPase domain-containing protein [candidate division WOR-3 bacterium]|nr:MAG: GTPase domain-containing protein [candidate division WOR-3 bacterium]
MANLNYAKKELNLKIVYYGTSLGGKTTNLRSIYAKLAFDRKGQMMSLATDLDQTIFFDFLPVEVGEIKGWKLRYHLYTVPGQVYYNASRRLVLRNVDGLVFVVDSQQERLEENIESMYNLRDNLKAYNLNLQDIPMILQYNKRDLPNIMAIKELEAQVNTEGYQYFESVAIRHIGIFETLKKICQLTIMAQADALPSV